MDDAAPRQGLDRRPGPAEREHEHPDLVEVARALSSYLDGLCPAGYLEGKTVLRGAVMDLRRCSALESEELVDVLEGLGFVEYDADPATAEGAEDGHWLVNAW